MLHGALVFGLAPLLSGGVGVLRARLLGRAGPPAWQPYRHLGKLLRKLPVIPDTATGLYRIWPFVAFAATAAAALLVPGFALGLATAPSSDFVTLIGLLALARGAAWLAGLETGFGFGGAGAARLVLFSIFAEAALLVAVLVLVLVAHDPTIDGIAAAVAGGQTGVAVPLGLALLAMLAVALTEAGRMPVDDAGGHLELAMGREALQLEYSGRYLALFDYTAMLRLMMWCSLIGTVFLPYGMARAAAVLSWPLGLVLWLGKLAVLAAVLAGFEMSVARMRVFRVPGLLGLAVLLGLLAAVVLFAAQRLSA